MTCCYANLIYCNKRKFLRKKKVQLSKDWFDTPTWQPFYTFVTKQYGGRDVMWKRCFCWTYIDGNRQQATNSRVTWKFIPRKKTGLCHINRHLQETFPYWTASLWLSFFRIGTSGRIWRYDSLHHAKRHWSVQTKLVKIHLINFGRIN